MRVRRNTCCMSQVAHAWSRAHHLILFPLYYAPSTAPGCSCHMCADIVRKTTHSSVSACPCSWLLPCSCLRCASCLFSTLFRVASRLWVCLHIARVCMRTQARWSHLAMAVIPRLCGMCAGCQCGSMAYICCIFLACCQSDAVRSIQDFVEWVLATQAVW